MGTIQYQKIGLRIAGTKSRNGGFTPLVAVGILAGNEGDNMDKITVVSEKPVYVIKHSKDYILYQLIDRKVKPCDRDTVGILSIALTIARDVQLANSKSPYSLLKEVYGKFVNNYMEHSSDGLDKFIDKDFDKSEFESILEEYPLETRSSTYIPMNPDGISGILCVPQDKMIDLFRDSQYSEFASFKEIEIGMNCTMMPDLENIEIPRPKIYSIVVNGIDVETTMKKFTDFFDTAKILHDTQDITYDNIHFSLAELLESPNHRIDKGRSYVELDTAHNRIVCNVYKKQITYTLEYFIKGGTGKTQQDVANGIATGQIKLTIGANVVRFPSYSPKRTDIPASYANLKVDIAPKSTEMHKFSVNSSVDNINRSVIITIVITASQNDSIIQNNNNYSRKKTNHPNPTDTKQRSNELNQTNSNNNAYNFDTPNKKNYARIIILLIGTGVSIFIGFIWGSHSYDYKLTRKDSVNIYYIIKREKDQWIENNWALRNIDDSKSYSDNNVDVEYVKEDTLTNKGKSMSADNTEANKEDLKNAARKAILNLVNNKKLTDCRKHDGWNKYLEKEERGAIEAVLDSTKYKQYTPQTQWKIKNVNTGEFNSFKQIIDAQKAIWRLINEDKKE